MQTAGTGGPAPEVSAAFLKNPGKVREAIALAVQLNKEAMGAPPGVLTMRRPGQDSLASRIALLQSLTADGSLTQAEADSVRATVLAADVNPLTKLVEAKALVEQGALTQSDFVDLKAALLNRLR